MAASHAVIVIANVRENIFFKNVVVAEAPKNLNDMLSCNNLCRRSDVEVSCVTANAKKKTWS